MQTNNEVKEVLEKSQGLERGMSSRHISMYTIGAVIGTGIFLASGNVIHTAGPGGAIVAYVLGAIIMYLMMACLGELTVAMPVSGQVQAYATEFINPAMGFTAGWLKWISCAVTVTAQIVASSIIMKNIFPGIDSLIWIVLFTILLFVLNVLPSRNFGETEFWFASVKVIAVVLFVITGIGIITGVIGGKTIGFTNFVADGGAFPNGYGAIVVSMLSAIFAFGGSDLIATAAGESKDPGVEMPKAIREYIIGITLCYVACIFLIGCVLPWRQANLAGSSFAYMFQNAGISGAALLVNIIVITAALSSANSFLYASTRTLWSLAKHDQAPKILAEINEKKVPMYSLIISIAFAALAVVSSFIAADTVYLFLISLLASIDIFIYAIDCVCQMRFRKRYIAEGNKVENLKYQTPLYPITPIVAIVFYIAIAVAMLFDPTEKMAIYAGVPTILILYFGFKFFSNTTNVSKEIAK
ncbi:amino acid permease [Sporomusa acidovorans]|uniref:Amino-acid permease RocE n=1 Tax=Sporomusa acidovorans (strain ATCC 49682 / DSM 3132 / Mol) TaxID=1123286 RepID=A0ABZ3J4M7_SPOA4|nr:amino acid permease [Sporomusa acidovorans]OZC15545.1 amino-acid permease RocE [Sporomusa acidovorans DSM 3132]SDE17709.1 arginine/ornithine permease [Sporomusa acidovorans]